MVIRLGARRLHSKELKMNKKAFYYWLSEHSDLQNIYDTKNDAKYLKKHRFRNYYIGTEDKDEIYKLQKHQKKFDKAHLLSSSAVQKSLHNSEKFVLDHELLETFGGINVLQKYAKDIKPFLPYPETFVQIKSKTEATTQLLIKEQDGYFLITQSLFNNQTKTLHSDPNLYGWNMDDYETWDDLLVKPDAWKRSREKYAFVPDLKNMKCDQDLWRFTTISAKEAADHEFSKMIFSSFSILFFLNFVLTYKNISKQTTYAGRNKNTIFIPKTYKSSDILTAPSYEHKTLEIELENDKHHDNSFGTMDYKPRKYHLVRAHLRKLASGDITLVKYHSRGDANLGVITKDYKIG